MGGGAGYGHSGVGSRGTIRWYQVGTYHPMVPSLVPSDGIMMVQYSTIRMVPPDGTMYHPHGTTVQCVQYLGLNPRAADLLQVQAVHHAHAVGRFVLVVVRRAIVRVCVLSSTRAAAQAKQTRGVSTARYPRPPMVLRTRHRCSCARVSKRSAASQHGPHSTPAQGPI